MNCNLYYAESETQKAFTAIIENQSQLCIEFPLDNNVQLTLKIFICDKLEKGKNIKPC